MNVVFIHGAGATARSFNYICQHLPHKTKHIFLEYDCQSGFEFNLAAMLEKLKGVKNIFIVAHSLGGIYALHLLEKLGSLIKGVVTLSTPYGGSRPADFLKHLFPQSQLLWEIGPNAWPIRDAAKVKVTCPWTAVITTVGNGYIIPREPNDGVVTLASMHARKDVTRVELACNHYEVVLSCETVNIIKKAISLK